MRTRSLQVPNACRRDRRLNHFRLFQHRPIILNYIFKPLTLHLWKHQNCQVEQDLVVAFLDFLKNILKFHKIILKIIFLLKICLKKPHKCHIWNVLNLLISANKSLKKPTKFIQQHIIAHDAIYKNKINSLVKISRNRGKCVKICARIIATWI